MADGDGIVALCRLACCCCFLFLHFIDEGRPLLAIGSLLFSAVFFMLGVTAFGLYMAGNQDAALYVVISGLLLIPVIIVLIIFAGIIAKLMHCIYEKKRAHSYKLIYDDNNPSYSTVKSETTYSGETPDQHKETSATINLKKDELV